MTWIKINRIWNITDNSISFTPKHYILIWGLQPKPFSVATTMHVYCLLIYSYWIPYYLFHIHQLPPDDHFRWCSFMRTQTPVQDFWYSWTIIHLVVYKHEQDEYRVNTCTISILSTIQSLFRINKKKHYSHVNNKLKVLSRNHFGIGFTKCPFVQVKCFGIAQHSINI